MIKRCLGFFGFLCIITSTKVCALEPYWVGNTMLFFASEPGEVARETRFTATLCGVETWYYEYRWAIEQFVSTGPFQGWLPGFGVTEVNGERLAECVWTTSWLNFSDIPWDGIYPKLCAALNNDRNYPGWSGWFDPFNNWKWRSRYMEERYMENGDYAWEEEGFNANCWGTADYLAKDMEWAGEYVYKFPYPRNDPLALGSTFPHIYLEGSDAGASGYKIDNDLDEYHGRASLVGYGYGQSYPSPKGLLNTFDVIRLSYNPYDPVEGSVFLHGIDVGKNRHCVSFLCTGEKRWSHIVPSSPDTRYVTYIYEKHNYGDPIANPYGTNILGHDDWGWDEPVDRIGEYDQCFNSFFKKFGYNKQILADYWCESWPDAWQIPQVIRDDEAFFYGYYCNY